MRRRIVTLAAALCALAVLPVFTGAGSASAGGGYEAIAGSGSSWAYGIIQPWIAYLGGAYNLQIAFNPSGSSTGRKDFANGQTQFGDSDIPYQGIDPTTGQQDTSSRHYVYLPVVAGGTAFTYHITSRGHLVNNLRLSGQTITKIFTNKITNWADPEITKENGGQALPSEPIKPVVRSDGSGSTAQFTLWMDKAYPSLWRPFNGRAGLTSIYPRQGNQIAVAQDSGIMNSVSSSAGEGEIGYTEYSYPLQAKYPVVYVENNAGYYVQPTQYNVAVALTKATINGCNASGSCSGSGPSYLTQNLDNVYTYNDPRTYPLSSYSYMIIPSSKTDAGNPGSAISVGQRNTLAKFLSYSLCSGQGIAGSYGYSPLPLNLVKAAFTQVEKLGPTAEGGPVSGVSITNPVTSSTSNSCNNPTFVAGHLSENKLAQEAPMPLACQKATSIPCGQGTVAPGSPSRAGSVAGGGSGSTANTTGTPTGAGAVNPVTGQVVGGGGGSPGTTGANAATANAITLSADRAGDTTALGGLAVLGLLAVVLTPGLYLAWARRRNGASS